MKAHPEDLVQVQAVASVAPPDLLNLYMCATLSYISVGLDLVNIDKLELPKFYVVITNDPVAVAKLGLDSRYWTDVGVGVHCFYRRCCVDSIINQQVFINTRTRSSSYPWVQFWLELLDEDEYLVVQDNHLCGYVKTLKQT